MTYQEYNSELSKYTKIISQRRSLQMTIRMNKAWLTNTKSKRGLKRIKIIKDAEKALSKLPILTKPKQPIGYQVFVGGDFQGFYATDDIDFVREQVAEYLGHSNFKLKAKPRFRDD